MFFLLSSAITGQTVTGCTVMQKTAIYACMRVLSEELIELALHIYQYANDGGKKLAIKYP